jgi:hypothetical protein
MVRLASAGITPVAPEIANVSAQVPTISSQLAVIVAQFTSIRFDFTTVSAKLLLRSSFTAVITILAHVGSQLTPVLPLFASVNPLAGFLDAETVAEDEISAAYTDA